ncbi:MAG: AAA family ATPase [Limisphaerales bacterium]
MSTTPHLTRCLTFLETQIGPQAARQYPSKPPTVTISRMTGTGGIAIADRLAERLQECRPAEPAPWTVFHRTLIEKVLVEHHLPSEMSRFMPEDRVSYITDTVEELLGLHPSASSMVTQVMETILHLAELGNCILVGRGSHIVLAQCETAFHVRLIGSLERRVRRLVENRNLGERQAREFIGTEDAARRRYLKTYMDADIDDPLTYHLVINTDTFEDDEAARLIAGAVVNRYPYPKPRPGTNVPGVPAFHPSHTT